MRRTLFSDKPPNEGWGVVRSEPWHFVGMFDSQEAAEAKAREMGVGYVARYGWNEVDTDSFVAKGGLYDA